VTPSQQRESKPSTGRILIQAPTSQPSRNPAVRPRDHPAPAPSSLAFRALTPPTPSLPLSLHDRLKRTDRPACAGRFVLFPGQKLAGHNPRHIPAPSGSSSASLQSRHSAANRGRERAAEHQRLNERTEDCWRPGTGRDSDAQVPWEDGKSPTPKEEPTNRQGGGGFSLLLIWFYCHNSGPLRKCFPPPI